MAYTPGEAIRRAVAPTLQRSSLPVRQPATTALRPGYNSPSVGPMRTDVSSTGGYGSYVLPPDPTRVAQIVNSQPGVMEANLALQTGTAQGDAGLRGLVSGTVADYGDPQFARDLGLAVDPETAATAQANTLAGHSQLALLNLATQHAADAMYTHLTGGGGLQSGELGFEQGLEQQRDSLARFKALTAVQDTLRQGITSNVNTQQNLRDAVTNAINKAQAEVNLHPELYHMPTATNVTVGSVPGMRGGTTGLAPGSYFNARGAGLPNYQPGPLVKPLAAPHLPGAPTMAPPPTSIQRPAAAPAPNALLGGSVSFGNAGGPQ